MQFLLLASIKHQEAKFYNQLQRHHIDHQLDGIAQLGYKDQFDHLHYLSKIFDFVIVVHFWIINHQTIIWEKH